jgi:type I restriction enzyme M protein
MYLIEKFASGAGKKGGEFYTPQEVSELLARLIAPKAGARICDPTCGSGSLLITVAEHVRDKSGKPSHDFSLYGQESNGDTWALAKLNMFLHGMDDARIEWGDTIRNPLLIEGDKLMKFHKCVANPPFSLDKWGIEIAETDKFNRFWRGIPPKSTGDFAFISHMIETLNEYGKLGVVVPHGVLFRGGSEGAIRQKMIENNLLEAVIGLPSQLFYGTGIPAAILIFNKAKQTKDVLFIDASREYQSNSKQNKLREQDIAKIVNTYKGAQSVDKYAYRATFDEIKENDFNLNIPRYVDTFEEEELIDIAEVQREIDEVNAKLDNLEAEMKEYLSKLQ